MSKNPALTRKLLKRMEEKTGQKVMSDRDRKKLEEDQKYTRPQRSGSSPEKQVLSEAQAVLIDIKKKFPQLSQHVEGAYMQLGQIINLIERGKETHDRRPQTI